MNKLLDSVTYGTCFLGITISELIGSVWQVLSIISLIISITCGFISVVMKIKDALKDGKIDDKEINDINKELENLKDTIDKVEKK